MQGQLKQQFHQMQVKFHNFMRKYKAELSIPRFNFLKQMTKGILASQSVIVRQAARSLHEQIPLRKTSGRLYRHLDQEDLASDIHDILFASQSRRLERDSLIFIDESDIVKPYATRMEGLEKIRDASANKTESGFHLINAVALVGTPSNHSIVPLCSKIYSSKSEHDTRSTVTRDQIDEITIHSNNRGVFVLDRWYDIRSLIGHFHANGNSFIIRSKGTRNLIDEDDEEKDFLRVCKSVKLTMDFGNAGHHFRVGLKRVKIRLNPHPVQNPETVEVWLVIARYHDGKEGGFFYCLCDFPGRDWDARKIVEFTLTSYRARWKIEEMHRQLKQDFGWEQIRLLQYHRLKNLNAIFWLAVCFLYSMITDVPGLQSIMMSAFIERKRDWKRRGYFIYYRLTYVISECFRWFDWYWIKPDKGRWKEHLQLKVRFE